MAWICVALVVHGRRGRRRPAAAVLALFAMRRNSRDRRRPVRVTPRRPGRCWPSVSARRCGRGGGGSPAAPAEPGIPAPPSLPPVTARSTPRTLSRVGGAVAVVAVVATVAALASSPLPARGVCAPPPNAPVDAAVGLAYPADGCARAPRGARQPRRRAASCSSPGRVGGHRAGRRAGLRRGRAYVAARWAGRSPGRCGCRASSR